jgi:glucose-6-phosphate isomerase
METLAWQKLTTHFLSLQASHLRELFAEDPERFQKFHLLFEDILVDYSKNIITRETTDLLVELAEECQLKEAIDAMFQGVRINQTEDRPTART